MTVASAPAVRGLIPDAALPAWQRLTQALEGVHPPCATDPDAWFAADPEPALEACGWCAAVAECRAFAVAAGERHGVWGAWQFPLKPTVTK